MVMAPWAVSVGERQPYVTPTECAYSTILSDFDLANLIEGGDWAVQANALAARIKTASDKIDDYCAEMFGSLVATQNTENARVQVMRDGTFRVHPQFGPILQLVSFAYGSLPGVLTSIPLSAQNTWIERFNFSITPAGWQWSSQGPLALNILGGFGYGGSNQYAQYVYVNGWQHGFLTADVSAGGPSISLSSLLGVIPGANTTIYDGSNTETVNVAATWNGSNPVTLTSALQYSHAAGTNVSAIPSTVKDACFHFIADNLSARGQEGITLSTTGAFEPEASGKHGVDHASEAYDLLDTFRKAWGRP